MSPADLKVPDLHRSEVFNFPEICEFDPAEEKDNSWLISFVDILSLLITLFVLLLSFSQMTRHAKPQNVPIATAAQSPAPLPVPVPKMAVQIPSPSAPEAVPTLSVPQNIKNMVDVVATATEINLVIKDDVLFAEGSADLTPLGRSVLDGVAQILKQNDYPISVEGHTDNAGTKQANEKLSRERAEMVKKYLVDKGVSEERIITVAYGEDMPVDTNKNAKGRANNRRVDVIMISR